MERSLFSKIIAGEIPSQKIYEDEYTYAFLDIKPVTPGHTLVIPKIQTDDLFTISAENWRYVMQTVYKIAPAIKQATSADGMNIIMNNRPAAGQLITDHAHVHLIPRHEDDGLPRHLLPQREATSEELTSVQVRIVETLAGIA